MKITLDDFWTTFGRTTDSYRGLPSDLLVSCCTNKLECRDKPVCFLFSIKLDTSSCTSSGRDLRDPKKRNGMRQRHMMHQNGGKRSPTGSNRGVPCPSEGPKCPRLLLKKSEQPPQGNSKLDPRYQSCSTEAIFYKYIYLYIYRCR